MVRFPSKFTNNFDENKKSVDALTKGPTTRIRNQIAGYITRTISLSQAGSETADIDDEMEEE